MASSDTALQRPVLVVDLDDTLVATDLLCEKILALLKQDPVRCMLVPFWLARGKAHLKQRLAENVEVDPACLPYREPVLDLIRRERSAADVSFSPQPATRALSREYLRTWACLTRHLDRTAQICAAPANWKRFAH